MNWFFIDVRKFFDFKGRAQRSEYWSFVLFYVLLGISVDVLSHMAEVKGFSSITLILLVPFLAVTTRRLHDVGRSGWLQIPPLVLAFGAGVTGAIAMAAPTFGGFLVFGLAMAAVIGAQGVLLYFFVKDSEPGDNRFGPNPKAELQP